MKFVNILEDPHPLYELCKQNGWTDAKSWDEFYDNGEDLQFFEGDPDMIKVDGQFGYFCEVDDTVYFYFDDFEGHAEMMLKKFFSVFKTGITLGGESWISGQKPDGVKSITEKHWQTWEKMETGIAWRGGAGYCYWITDWSEWLEKEKNKTIEEIHAEYFT